MARPGKQKPPSRRKRVSFQRNNSYQNFGISKIAASTGASLTSVTFWDIEKPPASATVFIAMPFHTETVVLTVWPIWLTSTV